MNSVDEDDNADVVDETPPEDIPESINAGKLIELLSKVPPDTVVYLETAEDLSSVIGAVYFPMKGVLSVCGHDTEIEIEEDDADTCQAFGQVSLYDEEGEELEVEPIEELKYSDDPFGEVDAPARIKQTS
jgi:hypothetical protein